MKKVYLDNASTTQIRSEVLSEMTKVLFEDFGNPSSTHSYGRNAKSQIELARKSIAKELNCNAQEIIFTSGGTEAINLILHSAVKDLNVKRIITSKIEHHAVLHTVEALQQNFNIQVDYVALKPDGSINISDLVELLSQETKTLVSLMHVNNEIGSVLELNEIGKICDQYNALFHSDTVQSVGKIPIDLQATKVDFIVASAHKFHGPKGIGFLFARKNSGLKPMFFGGEQEKGFRPGTEATHQIVGLSKALEYSYMNLESDRNHIIEIKNYLVEQLEIHFPNFKINGSTDNFYTIINILLPFSESQTPLLLFNLDMKGIAVSRGSACQSGVSKPSHVLAEILLQEEINKPSLRISFSHYNTKQDIDLLIDALK
jgi:cysteine desulfurase